LVEKMSEDALRHGLDAQRIPTATQAKIPAGLKPRPFRSKLQIPVSSRLNLENLFFLACSGMLVFNVTLPCKLAVVPQDDLVTPTSQFCTRLADLKVVGETLADDAQTATPPCGAAESREASPPVEDTRVVSPPRDVEAGEGTSVADIGVTTSPRIIDVDPISARPAGGEDLMNDQPQIDQAPKGLGTSGGQVTESSSSSPRLPRREINWNGTP
jgi:hypothetical protein